MQLETEPTEERHGLILPTLLSVVGHLLLLALLTLFILHPEAVPSPVVLEMGTAPENEDTLFEVFKIDQAEPEVSSEMSLDASPMIMQDDLIGDFQPAVITRPLETLGSMGFEERIRDARTYGIDIVIIFDGTSSMMREIDTVKSRVAEITQVVLDKVPTAKFSLVCYRDYPDTVPFTGIPLNNDRERMSKFMEAIRAQGGGRDIPEAVHFGMRWGTTKNEFREKSQKVLLLIGDAPPHEEVLPECIQIAGEFGRSGKSVVHSLTCAAQVPLPEFQRISGAGGGRAYALVDSTRLLEEILVLAFGQRHREKVLDLFNLRLERGMTRVNRRASSKPR